MLKTEKFTDICIPPVIQTSVNFQFSTYIFSADISLVSVLVVGTVQQGDGGALHGVLFTACL